MGKTRANRRLYIEILRGMTPERRLRKAFELGEMARELFRAGMKRRYPDRGSDELEAMTRERLIRWHSKIS
jgi:hypothetical protein